MEAYASTDRRVRKTRQSLRQGLMRLMEQKSIQDITVKELCAACDINRGTFYLHYTDVTDLLTSIEEEIMAEFEDKIGTFSFAQVHGGATPSPVMRAVFEFLAENADLCRVLLCANGDMAFLERVKGVVRARVMGEWHLYFPNSQDGDYAYAFTVSGCIGMLQYWLENDMPKPAQEIAALVEGILTKGMAAFGDTGQPGAKAAP